MKPASEKCSRTWIRITVPENVGETGTCYSKCETVEQISKRGYGNNFVFFCWNKLISFKKHNTQRRCENLATYFEFQTLL